MPRLDLMAWLIWIVSFGAEVSVPAFMLAKGIVRLRPAIFAFLLVHTAKDIALLLIAAGPITEVRAALYFYIYWGAAGLSLLLRIWIVIELASRMCVGGWARRAVRSSIISLGIVLAVLSVWASWGGPVLYSDVIMRSALTFNRALSLTWVTSFIVVALAGESLGLRLNRRDAFVASGLSLQAGSELIISWLLGVCPAVAMISKVQDLVYALSLSLWGWAICRSRLVDSPEVPNIRDLEIIATPLIHTGQRLKGR